MQFYKDIYSVILSHVHPYEYKTLKKVDKLFYRILRGMKDKGLQLTLTPNQKEIVESIALAPRDVIIQAPLSFGKTVTGLVLAMRFLRCVIIVPPVLIEQWIEEAKKTYGGSIFDPKSEESPLYVLNQKISPLQHKYLKSTFKEGEYKPRIILVSTSSFRNAMDLLHSYSPELIMVDECQKGSTFSDLFHRQRIAQEKFIGLTANTKYKLCFKYNLSYNGSPEPEILSYSREEVEDYIPEYNINYTVVEEIFSFEALKETMDYLNLQGHTVVYYSSKYFGSLTHTAVQVYFDVPIFFHTGKDAYLKFSQCPGEKNPILVYSYERGCEGLNLNVIQNIVLLYPNRVNEDRVNQAIGRGLRVTNPNSHIQVEAVVPEEELEMVLAFNNLVSPETKGPFLSYMKMKKPAFRFTQKRWDLASIYGLSELEYYILFHTNVAYKMVREWCEEQGLFSHIPLEEFNAALIDKQHISRNFVQ